MKLETVCSNCKVLTTDYCGVSNCCHRCCVEAATKAPGSRVYGLSLEEALRREYEIF